MSIILHDNAGPDSTRQITQRLDPLTDDEAVREVGWVARRARELVERSDDTWAEWAEFFDRRARLLEHMGQPVLASDARAKADDARGARSSAPTPGTARGSGAPQHCPPAYVSSLSARPVPD